MTSTIGCLDCRGNFEIPDELRDFIKRSMNVTGFVCPYCRKNYGEQQLTHVQFRIGGRMTSTFTVR